MKIGLGLYEFYDSSMNKPGYDNNNITSDGKIIGKVPQYIWIEANNQVYKVLSMWCTFYGCTNLVEAPEIPNTVVSMNRAFDGCVNLIKSPKIPKKVQDMYSTFYGCTNLKEASEIPKNVTNMGWAFCGCTSLEQAPEIPSNVTEISRTFKGCTKLTGTITINISFVYSEWDYFDCFKDTVKPITLTGTSQYLQEIAATANNGNVTVKE